MNLWRRPQPDIADSAHLLQRAAGQFQQRASGPRAVLALPAALAHLEEALERLSTSVAKAARAVDETSESGLVAAARPGDAELLRSHLHHLSERLLVARDACPEARRKARGLLGPPA